MQVTKQETEPCTYTLDIEVDAQAVSRAFGRAYRDFSQFTRVPGFRPGHAPRKVLERYVDDDRLRRHAMEIIAQDAYAEALKQEEIEPYDEPDLEPGDLIEGEPWRFQVTVAGQPRIVLGDYSDLAVDRPIMDVTDADVDRSVETIRNDNAELRMASGRGVRADDVLIVDMSIALEGEPHPEPQRSIVRLPQAIPGFAEAVEGQLVDEARTFTLAFPPDYSDKDRAGRTAEFRVTVASINERTLPEVTDEWIATLGPFGNVEAWRASLRDDLVRRMHELGDEVATSRIVKELVDRSKIEFPPAMLRAEVERDLKRLADELARNETEYDEYLTMMSLTREQHEQRVEQEAEAAIRTRLALREFAKAESVDLDEDEVESRYSELRAGAEQAGVHLAGNERDQRTRVANRILQEKLREKLMSMAKITDVPVRENN